VETAEINRRAIAALYDAFARHDAAAMVALLDDEVEWKQADGFLYAGTYVGPQAVLNNVWMPMGTEWFDWTPVPDRVVAEGATVMTTGTYTATHRTTGKPMRARFAHWFELRDGLIIRMEQVVDTAMVNQAL
jgi:uncharacterized protein